MICVVRKGIHGKELVNDTCDFVFYNDKELAKHLFEQHNIRARLK